MKTFFLSSILLLCFACSQPTSSDNYSETEGKEQPASPNEIDDADAEVGGDETKAKKDGPLVYITQDGDKYHTADCRYSKTAQPVRLTQAKADGKTACGVCKPNSKTGEKQVRCSGVTVDGTRCQRLTTHASGKCFQHQDSK
jgi:hypothetical protein